MQTYATTSFQNSERRKLAAWLQDQAQHLQPELVALRRDFHAYPETAWAEYRTSSIIAHYLQQCGFALTLGKMAHHAQARRTLDPAWCHAEQQRSIQEGADPLFVSNMDQGCTGLWGDLLFGPDAEAQPLVAFRFDIDANNGITESTAATHCPFTEGFASCHQGIMHACGHDGHIAAGLGLARLLQKLHQHAGDLLRGRVRLVFQPAEEEGEGAVSMLEAGAVAGVSHLFGMHLGMKAGDSGRLICATNRFLATTNFEISFTGHGAHAGFAPHEGKNALLAACTAVCHMQAIPRHGAGSSRINVGELHARETPNIIPAHAWLRGETRGDTSEINDYMLTSARRIAEAAAAMYGCTQAFTTQSHCPGASSSPQLGQLVAELARQQGDFSEILLQENFCASEDFSWFMNRVQEQGGEATYLQLGATRPSGHHTATFTFDEGVLSPAVALLACLALACLNEKTV